MKNLSPYCDKIRFQETLIFHILPKCVSKRKNEFFMEDCKYKAAKQIEQEGNWNEEKI